MKNIKVSYIKEEYFTGTFPMIRVQIYGFDVWTVTDILYLDYASSVTFECGYT